MIVKEHATQLQLRVISFNARHNEYKDAQTSIQKA